jgi:LysM repeat protein
MGNSQIIRDAAALMRKWGFDVHVHPTAETNGRPRAFDPLGVIRHHTGASQRATEQGTLRFVLKGNADLPGPLCQFFIARDGTVHVVTLGAANHAGLGGPWRDVPKDSGNRYLVGVEVDNDGKTEVYPDAQLAASRHLDAALLITMGKDSSWLIGHKEWAPRRKVDPKYDMNRERQLVAQIIKEKTAPPPAPTSPVEPVSKNYVVKAGDTLYSIAKRFVTTVADLMRINKLNDALIKPGQELATSDAPVEAPVPPPAPAPTPIPPGTLPYVLPLLRLGSVGDTVARLQSELNRVFPAYSALSVDGDFGPATERVVKEFQRRAGLTADGVVGPVTWDHLTRHTVRV